VTSLGRIVNHDPRSREFPAAMAQSPRKVLWRHTAAVLDQGQLGSCCGNALTQLLNTTVAGKARLAGTGKNSYLKEKAAVALYSRATVLDDIGGHYPPTDTGSSGLAVCKAGVESGYFTQYRHAFGYNQFAGAIQLSPVITGTSWYEGMFTPDADGYIWPTGKVAGGHEYLILGLDPAGKGKVTMLNSWSKSWGRNGRAFMRGDVYAELLAQQGDVTVPVLP
jgi:hypothetical protein